MPPHHHILMHGIFWTWISSDSSKLCPVPTTSFSSLSQLDWNWAENQYCHKFNMKSQSFWCKEFNTSLWYTSLVDQMPHRHLLGVTVCAGTWYKGPPMSFLPSWTRLWQLLGVPLHLWLWDPQGAILSRRQKMSSQKVSNQSTSHTIAASEPCGIKIFMVITLLLWGGHQLGICLDNCH